MADQHAGLAQRLHPEHSHGPLHAVGSGPAPTRPETETPQNRPAATGPIYTATGLPAGLSISAEGVISGLMTEAEAGTHTVTISAIGETETPTNVAFVWIVM